MIPKDFKDFPNVFAFTCDNTEEGEIDFVMQGNADRLRMGLVILMNRHPQFEQLMRQCVELYDMSDAAYKEYIKNKQ